MNLTHEFDPIRQWAENKGILASGDIKTQSLKTVEEVGELVKAILEQKPAEIADAIGDIVVTLVSVAYFNGIPFEHCINSAYSVIKDRTGHIKGGTFIKD